MARALTGSVRERAGSWEASVPRLSDPKRRMSARFTTEADAWAWTADQVKRLRQGLEPERSAGRRRGRPARVERGARVGATRRGDAVSLAAIGRRWHAERYQALEYAGADRAADVLADLEMHVFPAFEDLLGSDVEAGRARVIDWVRVMAGKKPVDPLFTYRPPRAHSYAKQTVTNYLWLLTQVLDYARELGHEVPRYTAGVRALNPAGRTKRKAVFVSVARALAVAGHLHVVHQVVLWLLRIAGLRISEAYGLLVANFFVDEDGAGYLAVENQGGKWFSVRDDEGGIHRVRHKEEGKTDAAYRLVALAPPLTELLQVVVGAFHTPPDGTIDMGARLVPGIRAEDGGQEGFRSALARAAALTGAPDDPDAYSIVPHELRKGFATDLGWDADVSDLVARRFMGHVAGSDVFSLVYCLDTRLRDHLAPGARAMAARVEEAGVDSLMVPTTLRPTYGKNVDATRVALADAVLEEAGWQVRRSEGLLEVAEVAAVLGRAESTTRRLMRRWIPAVKGERGEWLAELDDVLAFRARLDGHELLADVAEATGLTYHLAYQLMGRLGIEPAKDARTRTLLLTDKDARRIAEEAERLSALRTRAMPVAEAAAALGVAVSTARLYIRRGLLVEVDETDARGTRYVTRASVEVEKAARKAWRR